MTNEQRTRLANSVAAMREESELEALVSTLGGVEAQSAARSHTLPELVARHQGHGLDSYNAAFNRRAA